MPSMTNNPVGPAGWRAHAETVDWGRCIDISIAREWGRDVQVVTACDPHGATISIDWHNDEHTRIPAGLRFDVFMAEEVYKALDRIFGHENQDGAVEALQAALAKEQSRVDKALDAWLQPASFISPPRGP